MRGQAKITLYDSETNEKVFEHIEENMATSALSRYLSPRNEWLYGYTDRNFFGAMRDAFPLYSSMLGGVLLFNETISENENQILPPINVREVGHAGNEYGGSNIFRGSYNMNESGPLPNGFRHVWDFGTDKANGTIKALALTSVAGGNSGWRIPVEGFTAASAISSPSGYINQDSIWMLKRTQGRTLLKRANQQTGEIESITYANNNFYLVKETNFNDLSVTSKLNIGSTSGYTVSQIGNTLEPLHQYTYPESRMYYMDGKIHHVYSKTATSAAYGIIHDTYSLDGLRESRKDITVSAPFYGYENLMFYFNGKYFACPTSAGTSLSVYSSNGTLESELSWDSIAKISSTANLVNFGVSYIPQLGKIALAQVRGSQYNTPYLYIIDESLNVDAIHLSRHSSYPFVLPIATEDNIEPYILLSTVNDGSSSLSREVLIGIWTPYLGTINNLDSPVTKMSSHTMKIMYSIYNE